MESTGQIIYVEGISRIGKTTAIRSFLEKYRQTKTCYFHVNDTEEGKKVKEKYLRGEDVFLDYLTLHFWAVQQICDLAKEHDLVIVDRTPISTLAINTRSRVQRVEGIVFAEKMFFEKICLQVGPKPIMVNFQAMGQIDRCSDMIVKGIHGNYEEILSSLKSLTIHGLPVHGLPIYDRTTPVRASLMLEQSILSTGPFLRGKDFQTIASYVKTQFALTESLFGKSYGYDE